MSDQSKISNNPALSKVDKRLAGWWKDHPQVVTIMRALSWPVLTVVLPTFRIASCLKPVDEGRRSAWIVTLNVLYLATALLTVVGLTFVLTDNAAVLRTDDFPLWWLWAWFLWSRCAGVLIAFYSDAIQQFISKTASSDLTAAWWVTLALNGYAELIINYALLYTCLPEQMWCSAPARINESLWISASTITTSGTPASLRRLHCHNS